jgi:hypothetical protein
MFFRNREGSAVDPVPYLVVTSLLFLFCLSFGPAYCLALGSSLAAGLVASTLVFLVLAVGAYHQMVWVARPELHGAVPGTQRLQRLFYLAVLVALVFVTLSLPFFLSDAVPRLALSDPPALAVDPCRFSPRG